MSDTDANADLQRAIDQTRLRAAEPYDAAPADAGPKTFGSDVDGVREASREVRRKREEAAEAAPSDEAVKAAEHEVRRRWGAGHALRDVRSVLDAHYLHRDPALAESAIRKLEKGTKTPN
jgi:hypothetical protein